MKNGFLQSSLNNVGNTVRGKEVHTSAVLSIHRWQI